MSITRLFSAMGIWCLVLATGPAATDVWAQNPVQGTIDADTTWSGDIVVEGPVTVAAGATLAIDPGATVRFQAAGSLLVRGCLCAAGTEAEPILFTRYSAGIRWKRILFVRAASSLLAHATIEYADCEGEHQDYYEAGPRSYHEVVVVVASHVDFESCTFRRLPDDGSGANGDAIAVISDDPEEPGPATANIRGCRFLSIGQGVHERYSYVLVEDCFFTGKRGDNDDVDLYGESEPPPLIRGNVFLDPAHDDCINPTKCSARIEGNIISGSDDHGIVLRDASSPVLINNLIYDCSSAGIAIENSCAAMLINNTIVGCGRGLRLFDLGRWGAPYYLTPGGGTATVTSCIIWDCPQPITLADSSNQTIADRGSHVTVAYCDIEGGRDGISVSGSQSTVTWGEGNIDRDPRFVDAAGEDFHLAADSPAIDAGESEGAPAMDLEARARPAGVGFDMGAYEFGAAKPTFFRRGDSNASDALDLADAVLALNYLFAEGPEPPCLDGADANDDGAIDIGDAIVILSHLFSDAGPLPDPFAGCGPDPTPDGLSCEAFPPCP
ncbi:MAG: right-handed parallel beta-helix repeat-containing protein [Planctomycetes bacterium]|nr:right-handed parallel beta-helix repeat-containing protein [Planctomycetota bacterium]